MPAPYTIAEVLEYLLFFSGRAATDHPALDKPDVKTVTTRSAAEVRSAVELMSRCIYSIDASAGPALTAAFNAADPQRLDTALERLDAAARRWITGPHKQEDPCPPPPPPPSAPPTKDPGSGWWHLNGYGFLNYVFIGEDFYGGWFTVAGFVAISYVGLVAFAAIVVGPFLFVPTFITYEFESMPTDLDRQTAIAKIAQALRS
ncbi:MAG: hypothetical protein ACRDTV_00315 [Mycobacterium sp.]